MLQKWTHAIFFLYKYRSYIFLIKEHFVNFQVIKILLAYMSLFRHFFFTERIQYIEVTNKLNNRSYKSLICLPYVTWPFRLDTKGGSNVVALLLHVYSY
jgi:hypothetical protein